MHRIICDWEQSTYCEIVTVNSYMKATSCNCLYIPVSAFNNIQASAAAQTAGNKKPMSISGPGQSFTTVNMTGHMCRPAPSFAHGDLISAYAGLLIMFIMAIYARY